MRAQLQATGLLLKAVLLVPASTLAQPSAQVECYHTDVLGSVRPVTKQVNGHAEIVGLEGDSCRRRDAEQQQKQRRPAK